MQIKRENKIKNTILGKKNDATLVSCLYIVLGKWTDEKEILKHIRFGERK